MRGYVLMNKYNPNQIKVLLKDVNIQLDNDIKEYIKQGDLEYSRKLRQIRNKNIETLLLIHELEYKGILI